MSQKITTQAFVYELVPHHALFGINLIQNGYADLVFAYTPEYFERGATHCSLKMKPENMVAIRFPDKLAFDHFCRMINRAQKELEEIKNKEDKPNG